MHPPKPRLECKISIRLFIIRPLRSYAWAAAEGMSLGSSPVAQVSSDGGSSRSSPMTVVWLSPTVTPPTTPATPSDSLFPDSPEAEFDMHGDLLLAGLAMYI